MQPRPIRIEGDFAYVPLTKGYEAVVDAADAPALGLWNWQARPEGNHVYAVRRTRSETGSRMVYMHREIAVADDGELVDHRDGDGLHNRRRNLRTCTTAQNLRNVGLKSTNTSGHKGVTFDKRRGMWKAEIRDGVGRRFLGRFAGIDDAVAAREVAALALHGEFARSTWSSDLHSLRRS